MCPPPRGTAAPGPRYRPGVSAGFHACFHPNRADLFPSFVSKVQRSVRQRNAAPRHRLRPEGRKRLRRRPGRRVCASGQAAAGAAVRDGRVQAAVVHHRVERGENRGQTGGGDAASLADAHPLLPPSLPPPVLPVLRQRRADEGGPVSDGGQTAQLRLPARRQAGAGARLQRGSLRSAADRWAWPLTGGGGGSGGFLLLQTHPSFLPSVPHR